ncbi:MAG: PEP-CTERM sorting domain-containing protein [Ideonella sp.]|nr:PEP-CTERM sorting domain-containing protein [Ideonella sp.]
MNVFNSPRTAQAESDYGSTLLWTGVSSVLDANGQLVPDWVMRSGSGFDYSRSFVSQVPEPATVALMLAGLGVVGAAAKRRRAISASGAARPADA